MCHIRCRVLWSVPNEWYRFHTTGVGSTLYSLSALARIWHSSGVWLVPVNTSMRCIPRPCIWTKCMQRRMASTVLETKAIRFYHFTDASPLPSALLTHGMSVCQSPQLDERARRDVCMPETPTRFVAVHDRIVKVFPYHTTNRLLLSSAAYGIPIYCAAHRSPVQPAGQWRTGRMHERLTWIADTLQLSRTAFVVFTACKFSGNCCNFLI